MKSDNSKQFSDRDRLDQRARDRHAMDQWLDIALKQHGSQGPDEEMEARLLRHLRAIPEKSSQSSWHLVLAAASACALILIAVLVWHNRLPHGHDIAISPAQQKRPATMNAGITSNAPMAAVLRENTSRRKNHHKLAPHVTAQVWPQQFPTPRPLSQQEQLLVQYVREQPRQAQFVARARSELLKQTLAEFEARDRDKKISSAFE